VIDLFAPAESSVDTVRTWLESSGISRDRVSQSVNKQWLQFDGSTAELEALLHTEYHHYEHEDYGYSKVGCDE
jgi:tripeptidyl-peptidase-1